MKTFQYIAGSTGIFLLTLLASPLQAVEFPTRDVQLDLPAPQTPTLSTNPTLSVAPDGNVYVAWEDNRNGPDTIFFNHRFPEGGWESRAIAVTTGNPRNFDIEQGDATVPRICSDSVGRIYVVWVDNRAIKAGVGKRDIYLRYSKDFGSTWLPEFIDYRVDTDTPSSGDSVGPQIACDEDGHLYILWLEDRFGTGQYDPYFRSLQFTFQPPVDEIRPLQFPEVRLNVGEAGKPITAGTFSASSPRLATDRTGAVYAVWEDSREQPENGIQPGIYVNVSRDHGKNWGDDIRVDHRPLGFFRSQSPLIAADSKGGVHVVWLDNAGRPLQGFEAAGRNKLLYNRSLDYGKSWGNTDGLISNIPKTAEVKAASLSVNNKRGVFAIWTDNSGGEVYSADPAQSTPLDNFHVFLNHSESSGGLWLDFKDKVRIDVGNSDNDASNPLVVSDDLRNVFATWEEARNSPFKNLYFNFSPDHGKAGTWMEADFRVDSPSSFGNSQEPQMGTDGQGEVHLVYRDNRRSGQDSNIYYNETFIDIQTLTQGPRTGESCFIATAAFGSPLEPQVILLKQFRDRYLLFFQPGRAFVALYYRYSPPMAAYLNEHPALKPLVRAGLLPMVGMAALFVQTSLLQKAGLAFLILGMAAVILLWRRRFRHRPA